MKRQDYLQRLQQVLEPELMHMLSNAILPDGPGYLAFGRYHLSRENSAWTVAQTGRDARGFSSARSALAWCIADKFQQHHIKQQITNLDSEKIMLTADIDVRAGLQQRMRSQDLRSAVDAKLHGRRDRLRQVETRLDKCINLAKYWQIRGFNNETARTGRTPSHRSSR